MQQDKNRFLERVAPGVSDPARQKDLVGRSRGSSATTRSEYDPNMKMPWLRTLFIILVK
ncbi:hypothetical protein PCANC_14108 [Puccinia coronata f. sp. avenae]|uniref:Uncharacterized protein n=1 Tax=Puccinia coronata f. sp. avenae TaxID=200324 RepID=A0A2N5SXE0_9BASI|nr:hypothetical protein PCANC_15338 [Puccinia coronata f. sp. avenae]PLW52679.1 hypothetical protein PCANC_14108 [Puccinia coronata f. sp. avenae]